VVIILSRNPIPLWLNFLRNCLDASVLFVMVAIKFCVDIRKMPTETHKFIKQSVTHSNVSRSLVFKRHKRFSDGRGSLMDDSREGRPSFKTSDVVKNEVRDVIDGDRRLTVREVANKCITNIGMCY
jgi:hypothetical protein